MLTAQAATPAPEIPWGVLWGVLVAASTLLLSYLHMYMQERNRKLYAPLQPLYDEKGNPCWATRRDLDAVGTKVNDLREQIAQVDDEARHFKTEIALIKQAQMFTHQEMMTQLTEAVTTLKGVVDRLDVVSGNQRAQAEQLRIILDRREDA